MTMNILFVFFYCLQISWLIVFINMKIHFISCCWNLLFKVFQHYKEITCIKQKEFNISECNLFPCYNVWSVCIICVKVYATHITDAAVYNMLKGTQSLQDLLPLFRTTAVLALSRNMKIQIFRMSWCCCCVIR
jgi:hypothetical protein